MEAMVLVDWQNLFNACKERVPIDTVFGEITRQALERGPIREIRLFVPNYQLITTPWRLINNLQLRYGLTVDVCPALREGAEMEESYKDVVDFEILRLIMNYIHPGVGSDLIVFVSGDGHFIVAANEARRRGKEVEFWVVDPDATSNVILRNEKVREIKISDQPIFMGVEENPFLSTLHRATTEKKLNPKDKERLALLKKVDEVLFVSPAVTAVTFEAKLNEISQAIHERAGIQEKDVRDVVKALMALGVARFYPVVSQELSIDTSSLLFQWLKTT